MGGSCCRRRVADEEQEIYAVGLPAPECPQGASPGGSIYQRSQATGLLRRQVRTSSEELDRFGASSPPAYGSAAWWRCDDLGLVTPPGASESRR